MYHRLKKKLCLPAHRAMMNSLFTAHIKLKCIQFTKKYETWTEKYCCNALLMMKAPLIAEVLRQGSACTTHTTLWGVNHLDSVMVLDIFGGKKDSGSTFFHPKKEIMFCGNYSDVLKNHLQPFFVEHDCTSFMYYSVPYHKIKVQEYVLINWGNISSWLTKQLPGF